MINMLYFHTKSIIFLEKHGCCILLKEHFLSIFYFRICSSGGVNSSDSNENEPEPESLSLAVQKEPKSDFNSDSKAGITAALVCMYPKFQGRSPDRIGPSWVWSRCGSIYLRSLFMATAREWTRFRVSLLFWIWSHARLPVTDDRGIH